MKYLINIYVCFSLVFLPAYASASETKSQVIPPSCTEPLAVESPCKGVLLPNSSAAEGLRCLTVDVPKLKLELDFHKEIWNSREQRYMFLLDAEQKRGDTLFKLHQESLIVSETAWHQHPAFWFAVGFVVASGATIGITYAVNTP